MNKFSKVLLTSVLVLAAGCSSKKQESAGPAANEKTEGVMTYAEYAEAALETEVTIETFVQAKQSWWDNKANANTFTRLTKASNRSYSTKVKYFGARHPYKVRVRPYLVVNGKKHYGRWSYGQSGGWNSYKRTTTFRGKTKGICIKPGTIKNIRVTSRTKGWLHVTWKPLATKTDKVQIQMQRNNWGNNLSFYFTAPATASVFNHNTLHPGANYRVRMRSYHVFDGVKYYGDWSGWFPVSIQQ